MNIAGMNFMLSGSEEWSRLFDLDLQLLQDSLLTLIAVFVLFLAGSYFLFNPVRSFLERRKQKIADDIQAAKDDKEEAKRLKEEYEEKLKDVDSKVEEILADARKKALANAEKTVNNARSEADRIIDNANHEAALEKKRVANEVKEEIVNVASEMAGRIVENSMDDETRKRLLDDTLKEMGESTWLN